MSNLSSVGKINTTEICFHKCQIIRGQCEIHSNDFFVWLEQLSNLGFQSNFDMNKLVPIFVFIFINYLKTTQCEKYKVCPSQYFLEFPACFHCSYLFEFLILFYFISLLQIFYLKAIGEFNGFLFIQFILLRNIFPFYSLLSLWYSFWYFFTLVCIRFPFFSKIYNKRNFFYYSKNITHLWLSYLRRVCQWVEY